MEKLRKGVNFSHFLTPGPKGLFNWTAVFHKQSWCVFFTLSFLVVMALSCHVQTFSMFQAAFTTEVTKTIPEAFESGKMLSTITYEEMKAVLTGKSELKQDAKKVIRRRYVIYHETSI